MSLVFVRLACRCLLPETNLAVFVALASELDVRDHGLLLRSSSVSFGEDTSNGTHAAENCFFLLTASASVSSKGVVASLQQLATKENLLDLGDVLTVVADQAAVSLVRPTVAGLLDRVCWDMCGIS